MTRYKVTNRRAIGEDTLQEFDDREMAETYARILNDRHPDAHARVVLVRESHRARAHERRLGEGNSVYDSVFRYNQAHAPSDEEFAARTERMRRA